MRVAEGLGVDAEIVLYQKTPPDRAELEWLVAHLEDPPGDLVRKDSLFKKLGLDPATFEDDAAAVVDIILKHKMLMQRPVVVRGDRAIIGRPKERVREFLAA